MSTKTINHGLTVTPEMIIAKERDSGDGTGDWAVWHKDLASGKYLTLNSTDGEDSWTDALFSNIDETSVDFGNDPDGSGIYLNGGDVPNNYIAYFFASVEGYSKVGSYEGTGSATAGPFIALDFAPAYFLVKSTGGLTNWQILDNKRNTSNPANDFLRANSDIAETSNYDVDFLSNGLKIRTTDGDYNTSGTTYIYYAVAESPLKTANAR